MLSTLHSFSSAGWRESKRGGGSKALSLPEQLEAARQIARRCQERGGALPRELREHQQQDRALEYKDAQKL